MNRTLFKSAFLGEYMELLCKSRNAMVDEGGTFMALPIPVHGYILDVEDEFIMMGDSPLSVNKFVKINDVVYGEIIEKKTIYDNILEQAPDPETEEDVN